MKLKLLAGVAMAGLFSAGVANAEPNGWYGAIDAGYHTIGTIEADGQRGPQFDIESTDDWAAFARLGYRFDQNWRVELEGGYRSNDIESVINPVAGTPSGVCLVAPVASPCVGPDGKTSSTALMLNLILDMGNEGDALRPFIGLGAGLNRVNTEMLGTLGGNTTLRAIGFGADDSSTELAAQAIAGLAFAISDRAHLDLTYRYLMSNMEFASFTSVAANNPGPFTGRYDDSHTLTLGLRYSFGADEPAPLPPPPPPPPPPAPVIPADREFVVYFDWDRSDLTAEASSVVTQAANYAKSGRPTRILVVGHADTSGSAAYNIGLSNRRSRTVADALVAQGVNGGAISLDGKGETALARATADGVREPLNRRATIGINFR
jgi:outer membrane protein OmpA-like peptidoglycan-associated protein